MSADRAVTFVVPEGIDEEARVSGGNVFDLRVSEGLAASGWDVRLERVPTDAAASALAQVDGGGLVLIDGLVAGRSADAVEAEAARLRIVTLAHMVSAAFPGADLTAVEGERRALAASRVVVTTSRWTRDELTRAGLTDDRRTIVATPGADEAPPAVGTESGHALLCVGTLAAHKGQDVLVEALAGLPDSGDWSCTIAGSLEAEPAFAQRVRELADELGIRERVRIPGVLSGDALDEAYHGADLLVAPSRVESYGMAVADALRRGIPVVASDVGGIPEATAGSRAVILVPPGDRWALAHALGRWMTDPALRARLTEQARGERLRRRDWRDTAARVALALEEAR